MIPRDQLAAFLDGALDGDARAAVERELDQDAAARRFVLDQARLDRVLRSVLGAGARRQRLQASILAAVAGPSADVLRAQVLADTSGRVVPVRPARPPAWEGLRAWIGRVRPRLTVARAASLAFATVVVGALIAWFLFQPAPVVIGELAAVVGQPILYRGDHGSPLVPRPSSPVHLGDRLETGDADRAEIRFKDGTTLRLAFNTLVEVPVPAARRRPPASSLVRPPEVRLLKGHVWTQVQKTTNAAPFAIRTDVATAVARGTEFGVKLQSVPAPASPASVPRPPSSAALLAVLTVKVGAVDFSNAFGTVQATAMTESTARADSAPTEPRRLETLQTVQLGSGGTWTLLTAPLDWPEAATKLVGGGGSVDWELRTMPGTNGRPEVRVSRLPSGSPAARAGLRLGDVIAAVDGHAVTNAHQVAGTILFRPGAAVNLRVRRAGGEESFAVVVAAATNLLRGPELPAATTAQLVDLFRQCLGAPAGPTPDAAAESRRFERAAALSRSGPVRAAAFNQLGVALELEDALGPAVRAYGRAVYLDPDMPLYRFNLALALRKIGSFERALEEFEAAARLEPNSVPARLRVAEVTSLLGRHAEALALTEALLESGSPEATLTPSLSRPTGEGAGRAGEGAARDHGLWELRAQLLLKLQRPADAIPPGRRAAELEPDCPVAHAYLAEALHAAGRLDDALAAWTEALDRAPFEAAFILNRGTVQRDLGQSAAAEQSFRQALELRPDLALAHFNLGNALADRGEYTAAAAAFGRARELDPADARAHWRFGDVAVRLRQFASAERAYRDALEVAPNDPEALYGLGELYRLQRRPADAERAYRQAIELEPDYAAAHTALGIVFYDRGDVDEAERLYRCAIELDPAQAAPYHNLGTLNREARGDLDAAERWFRQALERAPDDGESLGGLGLVASSRSNLAEAERLLRQAIDRAPDSSALHNNLGEVLRERGRLDEAEPLYRKALDLDPDNPAPYGNLGIIHAQRKQFTEAERMFRALIEREQTSPPPARLPALVNLAMVCGEQGKLDEAERLYRQALELAPGHPRVANGLASFLADHQLKLDGALTLATRAVEASSDDPQFLDTLGWVQAQRGDLEDAERTLQRALERAGQEPPADEIRAHLEKVGRKRVSPDDPLRADRSTSAASAESGYLGLTDSRGLVSAPAVSAGNTGTGYWVTVLDFQLTPGLPARGGDIGTDASGTVLYAVGGASLDASDVHRSEILQTSRDQGANWVRLESKSAPDWQWEHARAFGAAKNALFLAGNGRDADWPAGALTWFIRESKDAGSTWSTTDVLGGDRNAGCAEIAVHPNGDVYAGGSSATLGRIIRKRPAGASQFATVYSTGPSDIGSCWAIWFAPDGSVVAAGDKVDAVTRAMGWVVLRSATGDAGTWQVLDTFHAAEWTGLSARGCRVSRSGLIYVSGWASNAKTRKNHWIVRASADGGVNWSVSDDFNYGGATVQVSEIEEDAAGNVYVCGEAADSQGRLFWIVRKGSGATSTANGKPGSRLDWSTSDTFQLTPGRPALPLGLTVDAAGNVFACGRAQDAAGIEHFIVRKLPRP